MTRITEDEWSVANADPQSWGSLATKNIKKGQPLTLTLDLHINLSHFLNVFLQAPLM